MACNTPTPLQGEQHSLGDRLEAIDDVLYHFQHVCGLLGDFAGQHGGGFTDGLQLERYAVVFGFVSDELRQVRDEFTEVRRALHAKGAL